MTAKLYLGGFHIYPTPPPWRWVKTRFICVVRSKLPALWAQLGTWGKKIKLLFLPSAIHCHRRQRSQSESQPVVQEGSGDLQGYSALRWKPEGPERHERLFLRSRCNQGHVMREEQSAGVTSLCISGFLSYKANSLHDINLHGFIPAQIHSLVLLVHDLVQMLLSWCTGLMGQSSGGDRKIQTRS